MEIIIAMTIAFILGAYVRKPFEFRPKAIEVVNAELDKQEDELSTAERKRNIEYAKQFNDVMAFTGRTKDED